MDKKEDNIIKGRGLSAEELALWRAVTRDVALQDGAEYQDAAPQAAEDFAAMMAGDDVQMLQSTTMPPEEAKRAQQSRKAKDLDKRTAMRLERGQLEIESRIDLHGLGQAQAQERLNSFLLNAYAQGKRCVLVITGKGGIVMEAHLENQTPGVLRRKLPHWVKEPPLSDIVLSLAQASVKHGGGGAYYVLLRRKR